MTEPRPESPLPPLRETEVWAVPSQDGSQIAGFLVTDAERWPGLIAFVEGATYQHALVAWLIAAGKISPDVRVDLRGMPVPQEICGRLLIPLCLENDDLPSRPFVAGIFQSADSGQGAKSFSLIGSAALTPQQNLALGNALRGKLGRA